MSGRRMGSPRTDEERRMRHGILRPGERLPARGTGLRAGTAAGSGGNYRLTELLAPLLVLACVSIIEMFLTRKDDEKHDS